MPPTAKTTPAEWLDLIVERAAKLRDAGVSHLAIGDVVINFHPAFPELAEAVETETTQPRDAMEDPDTYGGPVPKWADGYEGPA